MRRTWLVVGDIVSAFDPSVVLTLRAKHPGDRRVTARFDGLEHAVDLDQSTSTPDTQRSP